MTDLLAVIREHSFRGHQSQRCVPLARGRFHQFDCEIHTANKGTTFVYLIGLLEYHPGMGSSPQHAKPGANMFRKVEAHAWPGWDGLIVGYDTNTQVYEIAVSNGEFDDAKKNEFDVKGSRDL
ncbi:hypothetical protein RI054_20g88310 [Pseudoscourfieldia marina]